MPFIAYLLLFMSIFINSCYAGSRHSYIRFVNSMDKPILVSEVMNKCVNGVHINDSNSTLLQVPPYNGSILVDIDYIDSEECYTRYIVNIGFYIGGGPSINKDNSICVFYNQKNPTGTVYISGPPPKFDNFDMQPEDVSRCICNQYC